MEAGMALSEALSVDSDTSRPIEGPYDKTGAQRRRKQRVPMRSALSSDTPSGSQPAVDLQQQGLEEPASNSNDDSPVLNNHADAEGTATTSRAHSSSKGSKSSPGQRQGPCGHCKTPHSPQWRKGPRNKPVLCNACGIRYLRNRHLGRAAPHKKRVAGLPPAKKASAAAAAGAGAGTDSGAEASMDTMNDMNDMTGPSKKRQTRKAAAAAQDTGNYTSGDAAQAAAGSNSPEQQVCVSTDPALLPGSAWMDHSGYLSGMAAAADPFTGQATASLSSSYGGAAWPSEGSIDATLLPYSTSLSMPGNLQPWLDSTADFTLGGSIYRNTQSMAVALQLYQQNQQQQQQTQQLFSQQTALLDLMPSAHSVQQASSLLTCAGGPLSSLLADSNSQPGSPALINTSSSSGYLGPASMLLPCQSLSAPFLTTQLLQQQLQQPQQQQGVVSLQQAQQQQQQPGLAQTQQQQASQHTQQQLLQQTLQQQQQPSQQLLQAHTLQGYLLQHQQQQQEQQQQQQSQYQSLQGTGMLHGPSPLSLMSSAHPGNSLSLGASGSFSALLSDPFAAAPLPVPNLEIAPLVTGDHTLGLCDTWTAPAASAATAAAAAFSAACTATAPNFAPVTSTAALVPQGLPDTFLCKQEAAAGFGL